MLNEFSLQIAYLIFFIPLIMSILINFIEDKKFIIFIINITILTLIVLSIKILININFTNSIYFINTSEKFNILGTEFKISVLNLFFLICILFCNFIGFINYINEILLNKNLNSKYIKYFFSIYLLHIFSTVGIILTYNIFNLFIFLEIYSLCIYVMISIYKKHNLNIISYKYFSNNIFGSVLSMLTIFYISIYFNTPNMLEIKQQLVTINLKINIEIILMFILFLFSIIIKFFSTNTSKYHNTETVGINFLSISNIFINVLIGIYLLLEILFFILNKNIIFNIFYLKYIIFFISIILIIYNSIKLTSSKEKTLFNIFLRFNLINFGYILLSVLIQENNSNLSWILLFLYLFEFITINLLIYLFSAVINIIYKSNSIEFLNNNKIIKILFLSIILFKIFLPFGTSLYTNIYFISYVIKNNNILYLIPYLVNKICYILLFVTILNNDVINENENTNINKKYLNILYSSIFIIFTLIITFEVFIQKYIKLII